MIASTGRATATVALSAALLASLAGAPPGLAAERVAATPVSSEPAGCSVDRLDVPAGTLRSQVAAGEPTGRRLAGIIIDSAQVKRLVVWDRGVPHVVPGPSGDFEVTSISRRGTVGGFRYEVPLVGFVITPEGGYREVTRPAGADSDVWGVRDSGAAVGSVIGADHHQTPVRWPHQADRDPVTRPLPDGLAGVAVGLASDGSIAVTTSLAGDQPLRAYAWTAEGDRLRLRGTTPSAEVGVGAIARGYAAGYEAIPGEGGHILRWRLPGGKVTPISPPGEFGSMSVNAVNSHGVIGGQILGGTAALVIDEDVIELPSLDPSSIASVHAVATNGQAAGWSRVTGSGPHAVTWTCG